MPKQSSDKVVDQQPPFPYGKTYSWEKKRGVHVENPKYTEA